MPKYIDLLEQRTALKATKEQMFVWVEQMWQQKDGRIATMLAEFEA